MHLDSTTVIATAAFVAGMSGAFMLVAGGKLERARPTTIWGVANLFIAVGMLLVLQGFEYDLAFLATMAAGALTWGAMARFNWNTLPLTYPVAGLAVWTFLVLGPWEVPFGVRAAVLLMVAAGFFVGCAKELWNGRAEALPGRWPVLALVSMKIVALLIGAGGLATLGSPPALPPGGVMWVYYLVTVAFTVGTSMFFVAMTKERTAVENELAAVTDSLTGLANRGALLASADVVIAETVAEGRSVGVAVFDLDQFKLINDTYGHRTGDAVLRRFAERAVANMRGSDLIGRIGGEEFAAIIPGAHPGAAMDFAERVRIAFSSDPVFFNGREVKATVSSGVAVVEPGGPRVRLDDIFDRADIALYVAKSSGRDRVALSPAPTPPMEIGRARAEADMDVPQAALAS